SNSRMAIHWPLVAVRIGFTSAAVVKSWAWSGSGNSARSRAGRQRERLIRETSCSRTFRPRGTASILRRVAAAGKSAAGIGKRFGGKGKVAAKPQETTGAQPPYTIAAVVQGGRLGY